MGICKKLSTPRRYCWYSALLAGVSAAVLLVSFTETVLADDDPNVVLMKKLYTKIGAAVGVGDNQAIVGESFLVLANPGILIDPTLDLTKQADRQTIYRTLDKVLVPSWILHQTNEAVMDVYDRTLQFKELPIIKPNAQQQKELDAARKIIYSDNHYTSYSDAFIKYRSTKKDLNAAIKAVEDWRRTNPDPTADPPTDLVNTLQDAQDDFDLLGHRAEIAAAKDKIDMYENLDPSTWWNGLRDRFQTNTETLGGNRFPKYDLYPRYPTWLDPKRSWSNLSLSQSQLEVTQSSSHVDVGGGLSFGWGPWSVGGSCSSSTDQSRFQDDVSGYNLSMELMTVEIDRPWMETFVYDIGTWRWLYGSPPYGHLISDGADATSGKSPTGTMPFVPTGLLLARNFSISGNWHTDLQTAYSHALSCGGSIGWGPFSIGGRYNENDQNSYLKANAAGNGLSFGSPQIIGMFVDVLPKSPNPDLSLPFPPAPASSAAAVVEDTRLLAGSNELLSKMKSLATKNAEMKAMDLKIKSLEVKPQQQ